MTSPSLDHLHEFGCLLLPQVFDADQITALSQRLADALQADEPSVLRSRGRTYGSRDLIRLMPEIAALPRQPRLRELLATEVGPQAGLVRALYFDKPPDRSWSLPWHKDRTIAVRSHDRPSPHFSRPTMKAGIPHVEACESLLATMLTLRIHLDPMTPENGPLSVIPGSHQVERESTAAVELHAQCGDVLAMRPLLSHSSSLPHPGTTMHRRVIHLEFAPSDELPDGYQWHTFLKPW